MREAPERFVKNRCRIRVAVGPRLLERADGAATTTSTAGSYEISGVPQMMRSARSQVRSPAMNGTSSAIHSYRFVALCGPPGVPTRARLRRSVSSSSDCTHIRVSISSAASRRPAPTPSTISNGHPAGTGIDPSRPCSAHCGGRKVTVPPWCTGIRIGTFCLVELARLELATPCLQTTGSTSTAVHPRRSPSRDVHLGPLGSRPVAVLSCCTHHRGPRPPRRREVLRCAPRGSPAGVTMRTELIPRQPP